MYESRPLESLPARFLVVANHQSLLDIIAIMYFFRSCRRIRFVAKRELGCCVPFISSVLRVQGHALIARAGDARGAMDELSRYARRCAREGTCPVIFPEGTRSRTGELGQFYTAGLRRILEEGGSLPLLSLAVDGGWRIRGLRGMIKNLRNGIYRIKLVEVYDAPRGRKEVLEVLARCRDGIASAVSGWRPARTHGTRIR
ncbi:MAG TPA: lysophospholipid acyltransferase family protein [Magnetospirillaceae bacterium]|nr:lysophospholipid acyltransferase family protein [Magnetospirillaceae bacterium]